MGPARIGIGKSSASCPLADCRPADQSTARKEGEVMAQFERVGGVPLTAVRFANDPAWKRAFVGILVLCAIAASRDAIGAVIEARPDAWIALAIAAAILLSALVSSVAGFAFSAVAG